MQSSNANGVSVTYTYDNMNRLQTVVDNNLQIPGGQKTTTYTYDPASNLATVTYPNGLESQFTYDTLNRITAMNAAKASYSYTLSPTGNRTGAVESSGRTLNWSYDGIYRLTNENITADPNSKTGTVSYGLDPVGNRQTQTSSIPGVPTAGPFTYDQDDRLSTESYDANGNTTVSGSRTFAYDFANRLKSMTNGSVTATLVYDGDGNRVAKTVGGVTTRYLVDELNPTGYAQVVEELVGTAVQRTYTYGIQRISQNRLVSGTEAPSFYGYDGGGSVRTLTDSSGTVIDTYDFDAWGNAVNTTGSTPNVYLYRGEQYDPDLGLYDLRARYLNPATGRFLSTDPSSGSTWDPATLHKYLYGNGNPANREDPTGWAGETPGKGQAPTVVSGGGGAWTPEAGGYVHLNIGPIGALHINPHPVVPDICNSPPIRSLMPPPVTSDDFDRILMRCLIGLPVHPAGAATGAVLLPIPKGVITGKWGSLLGGGRSTSLASALLRDVCSRSRLKIPAPTFLNPGSGTANAGGAIARWLSIVGIAVDVALVSKCFHDGLEDFFYKRWQPLEECGCAADPFGPSGGGELGR
jgi:RHS repeat-associated protein